MRIKNEYGEKIYWRAFKGDDTSYVVGLKQGSADTNGTDSWRDDSFPEIKVEAKTGDIVFSSKVLAWAGTKFKMTDDLVVTSGGELKVAEVKLVGDRGQEKVKRSDIQFIDTRGFDASVERTMVSRVSTTFTNTEVSEITSSHEQTWTVGGKLGGMIGKKDEGNVNGELSAQFQDKVVNAMRTSHQTAITSVWEKSVSDKITFAKGKLYVVEVSWTLTLDKGSATYMGERSSYSVVRSADPDLLRPTAFDSPAQLPPQYATRWNELNKTAHA